MIKNSIKRNTRRAVLVLLALIVSLASVSLPGAAYTQNAYAQDKPSDYIKSIKYSNIYNSSVRKEVTKALKCAKIPQKDIDCFIWNVKDYNKTIKGKGLIKKGYRTTKNLVPEYDVIKLDSLWGKKYDSFIGNNCRITAFTLMHSKISVKKSAKDKYMTLFMDKDALSNSPKAVLKGKEKKKFMSFYAPIPAKDSTDSLVQAKQIKKYLKKRGVSFKKGKASLISVYMHSNFGEDENYLFIGHTGVLVKLSKKKFMFIEKVSFQEPYHALIFSSKAHLNDYLMKKYDVEFGQGNARPIIFENGDVMEGYRPNPDNE